MRVSSGVRLADGLGGPGGAESAVRTRAVETLVSK